MKHVRIQTDGGSRGNPGPAGIGFVILDSADEIIFRHGAYIGTTTNNVAEYSALVKALETALGLGATHLDVRMDSELIVRQMNGQYKVKDSGLLPLAQAVRALCVQFAQVKFTHIRREYNKDADSMVNEALDAVAR